MVKKRIEELIKTLNYATLQYDMGTPIMSDLEWDTLYFELVRLENEHNIYLPDSPTQTINYEVVNQLEKIEHNHKMLSLKKTKELDEINKFLGHQTTLAMCKMDGLTCSLRYINGTLVSAETRGNGIIGENILHNAKVIPSIPKKINYLKELVLDGEIICTYADFKSFEDEYKNPRNFASGSIRLLDSKECQKRKLKFVVWDVIKGMEQDNLSQMLDNVDTLGFITVPRILTDGIIEEEIVNKIKILAQESYYPIDGAVFKFNDVSYGKTLGETGHHLKNAMAFKFYDETYPTELQDIEWTMGRTGVLTPVAIFSPVDIEGSTVRRATMHNITVMKDVLGDHPYVEQKIEVFKANMINPQVDWGDEEFNKEIHKEIFIPNLCPICGQPTEQRKDIDSTFLICANDKCDGKLLNKLDHFCGKTGLDIKGLSVMTLEKLMNWGWITNLTDIYELSNYKTEWCKKPGFGLKSVSNILNAIELSKNCSLQAFISAIGIPLVGVSVSKELSNHFDSWEDFRTAVKTNYKFFTLDGFGIEMDRAITNFNYEIADTLVAKYLNIKKPERNVLEESLESMSLKGVTVVITGKLTQFKNRSALQAEIEKRGGKVASSVSKNTKYLINNDNKSNSSKNVSAQKLGIPVVTELEFKQLFLTN